jgi:hypothetical protein
VRAFEATADAVRTVNRVRDYGIDQNMMFRNLTSRSGPISISGVQGPELSAPLARVDFDRSLLLAQSLENRTVRLNSIIAVAMAVLENKKASTVY